LRNISGKEATMASQAQIDELQSKMREQRGELLTLLEAFSEEDAERSTTGEGEWSAKQQMSHLCEMEGAYRAWVEKGLEEDGASVDGVSGEPPAIRLEKANAHTVAEHIAEMRRQRTETEAVIDSMKPADFERRASNKIFGSLTLMQWLRSYYRHDRMHCDQLRGVEPEYKPRYAGGREPDQRRL
jgi:uncharacterized damage-inducible protein DinB